jgi:hypothetical protein
MKSFANTASSLKNLPPQHPSSKKQSSKVDASHTKIVSKGKISTSSTN